MKFSFIKFVQNFIGTWDKQLWSDVPVSFFTQEWKQTQDLNLEG